VAEIPNNAEPEFRSTSNVTRIRTRTLPCPERARIEMRMPIRHPTKFKHAETAYFLERQLHSPHSNSATSECANRPCHHRPMREERELPVLRQGSLPVWRSCQVISKRCYFRDQVRGYERESA
jgi:hypothetical protein